MRCLGEVERLDARLASLAQAETGLRLRLGQVLEVLGRGKHFELGFSSVAAYVQERCDRSVRWVEAARCLARRLEALPELRRAMALGGVGGCVSWSMGAEVEMAAFHELEQAVVSGRVYQPRPANDSRVERDEGGVRLAEPASEERRAWLAMLGSLSRWLEGGLQMSAAGRRGSSAGRATLRLRVTRSTYVWWRDLEAQARRWLPRGLSFLSFLCLSMWQAWRHLLGPGGGMDVAYGPIYIRDRYRCTSPVCSRKDVTPHHLQFRSAGGSDKPANITSVCLWCHLCGVHGGRIRAAGSAGLIHWELGPPRSPCVVVHGRERVAA